MSVPLAWGWRSERNSELTFSILYKYFQILTRVIAGRLFDIIELAPAHSAPAPGRTVQRHAPRLEAQCDSSARWDLCGARLGVVTSAMKFPMHSNVGKKLAARICLASTCSTSSECMLINSLHARRCNASGILRHLALYSRTSRRLFLVG